MLSWFRRGTTTRPRAPLAPMRPGLQRVRGRLVAKDLPYLLPKDVEDANRLDFQHYMLRVALGGLYRAPIQKPHAILDVATGTGRWAMEMARQFPRAVVTGLDIVPPPADDASAGTYNPALRPANYVFQQGNMFASLPFDSSSFDFVHMRLVYAATPVDKWPPLVRELIRVTKPGGYIELVEGYVLTGTGPATLVIQNAAIALSKKRGIDVTYGKALGLLLVQCGMLDILERAIDIPIGAHHSRLGALAEKDILSVFKALGTAAVDAGLLDEEEFIRAYALMPSEFASISYLTTWPVFQVFGRKPQPIRR